MNDSVQPGWYPDPNVDNQLRWWDGTAWTANTAPQQPQAVSPQEAGQLGTQAAQATQFFTESTPTNVTTNTRKSFAFEKMSKKTVLIAPIATLVIVVGIVAAMAMNNRQDTIDGSKPGSLENVSYTEIISSDEERGLDFTATVVNAPRGESYIFKFNDGGGCSKTGYTLFTNPALTEAAGSYIEDDSEEGCILRPGEHRVHSAREDSADAESSRKQYYTQSGFTNGTKNSLGMYNEYYLVREISESGETLDRPVVTKIVMAEARLSTPQVVIEADSEALGETLLKWNPVEGADTYVVIARRAYGETVAGVTTDIAGVTSDTKWSTSEFIHDQDAYDSMDITDGVVSKTQNEAFLYEGMVSLGVVAINSEDPLSGAVASGIANTDFRALASSMPYTLVNKSESLDLRGLGDIPSKLDVEMVSGDVKAYPTILTKYSRYTNPFTQVENWEVVYSAAGTSLGGSALVRSGVSEAELVKGINEYNQASLAASGDGTGAVIVAQILVDEGSVPDGIKEAPDTEYPFFGSTAFSRFLAQHIVAGTDVIDISEWLTVSGQPNAADAFEEAVIQNPYAMVAGFSVTRDKIVVEYTYPLNELRSKQRALHNKVQELAGSIPDGATRDRLKAAYSAVINTVSYDYNAKDLIAQLKTGTVTLTEAQRLTVDESQYAYTALVEGSSVCTGYAVSLKALLHEIGVDDVMVVYGGVTDSNMYHAWNRILIDGKLYDLDATWDDAGTGGSPKYYLVDPSSLGRVPDTRWIVDMNFDSW